MSFVKIFEEFLKDPGPFKDHKRLPEMQESVKFLLHHAVGEGKAISTQKIIDHLKKLGYATRNKEDWQINVLGPLKKHGYYIGSKRAKGMFIIDDEKDANIAISQIEKRIYEEYQRMEILKKIIEKMGWNIQNSYEIKIKSINSDK